MVNTVEVPYVPAAHLVSGSLTAAQVIAFFEDFRSSLRYVSTAPELVFERIVANLSDAFKGVIEQGRQQHSRDRDSSEAINQKLQAEVTELRRQVSEKDSECKRQEYTFKDPTPTPSAVVEIQRGPNPFIGNFTTDEIRYWFQIRAQTSKMVKFGRPYLAPPGLPVGLSAVHMSKLTNARIKSYASDIRDDRFEVHVDSWDNTILFNASCTWLEIEADDPDFQFGSYSTLENQIAEEEQQQNSRQIVFSRPYDAPPCVVVWLSGFEMRSDNYWRVKAYATDVTATGFSIHVDTWDDTVLLSGMATWVAYTAGMPGVCSGTFSTGPGGPKRSHSGYEKFENGVFGTCPRTVVALNKMDVSCSRFLRVRVKASEVTVQGMRWNLEGWVDTDVNSAGAAYIALRWA